MAAWPGSLPAQVQYNGFRFQLRSTTIETAMDTGPTKTRQRFTAAPEPYQATLMLTDAQVATFRAFFYTDTAGGSVSFTGLAHPITGGAVTHKFLKPQEPPALVKIAPDIWEVTFGLQVMP